MGEFIHLSEYDALDETRKFLEQESDFLTDEFVAVSLQISAQVHGFMQIQGITKENLVECMDVPFETIDSWLSGIHDFTISEIIRLRNILGIVIEY